MEVKFKRFREYHPILIKQFGSKDKVYDYYNTYCEVYINGEHVGEVFQGRSTWTVVKNGEIITQTPQTRKEALKYFQ